MCGEEFYIYVYCIGSFFDMDYFSWDVKYNIQDFFSLFIKYYSTTQAFWRCLGLQTPLEDWGLRKTRRLASGFGMGNLPNSPCPEGIKDTNGKKVTELQS